MLHVKFVFVTFFLQPNVKYSFKRSLSPPLVIGTIYNFKARQTPNNIGYKSLTPGKTKSRNTLPSPMTSICFNHFAPLTNLTEIF